MFILWVRGGAYFLHFAAGTDLSFYKLEEKREKAARWVTHRGSHSKPHIQVDSSVCFFYEGFKEEALQVLSEVYCQALCGL